MEELVEGHRLREGYAPDDFTVRAVHAVLKEREAIDAELSRHTGDWALARVAPLERNILRLALWEMRDGVTPPAVAIDEAVRLAKRYSTADAGSFVNGVLGAAQRQLEVGDGAD